VAYNAVSYLNPRILTPLEREKVKAYLKADGEKGVHLRQLIYQSRQHLPTIVQDVALLQKLMKTYRRDQRIEKA